MRRTIAVHVLVDSNGRNPKSQRKAILHNFCAYFEKICIKFMQILTKIALILCNSSIFVIGQVMQWNNFTNISQES